MKGSAALQCRRAFSGAFRSDRTARKQQANAAREVEACCLGLQYRRIWERLVAAPASSSGVVVRLWSHEMDTTKQKMRLSALGLELLPGEEVPSGSAPQTVMVQSGCLHERVFQGPGSLTVDTDRGDAYVCKGLVLDVGGADAYLEALLARPPFNFGENRRPPAAD